MRRVFSVPNSAAPSSALPSRFAVLIAKLISKLVAGLIATMATGDFAIAAAPACSARMHAATLYVLDMPCQPAAQPSAEPDASTGTLACEGPSPTTEFAPTWYYVPLENYRAREMVPEQWIVPPPEPSAWIRDHDGLHRAEVRAQRQFRHSLRFRFDSGGAAPLRPASEIVSPILEAWMARLRAARDDAEAMHWLSWSIRTRHLGCTPEAMLDRWLHRAREMREEAGDGSRQLFAAVAYVGTVPASIVHYMIRTGRDGRDHILIVDSMQAPSTLLDPFGKDTVHNGIIASIHHMSAVAAEKTDFRSIRVGMSLRVKAEAMREAGFTPEAHDEL